MLSLVLAAASAFAAKPQGGGMWELLGAITLGLLLRSFGFRESLLDMAQLQVRYFATNLNL